VSPDYNEIFLFAFGAPQIMDIGHESFRSITDWRRCDLSTAIILPNHRAQKNNLPLEKLDFDVEMTSICLIFN